MSNCHACYWSDRDPKSREQIIHEEPDYLAQGIKPGTQPPDVRIVKACGKGQHYFKSYGAQDHDCSKFAEQEAVEAEDEAEAAEKRAQWRSPTSRHALPKTINSLPLIEVMSEKNNEAYELLVNVMGMRFEDFGTLVKNLDDMNIRGAQIPIALDYAETIDDLIRCAKDRESAIVYHVNTHYDNVTKEKAVQRGAHKYGHKKAKPLGTDAGIKMVSYGKIKRKLKKPMKSKYKKA